MFCEPNFYIQPSPYPYSRQYRAADANVSAEWDAERERAAEAGELAPEVTLPTPEEQARMRTPGASRYKTVSEARLAANRANARKSTGPKTPAGKAASSRNALRHGAYSTVMVLPDEDPRELAALQEELIAELRPRGILQREIVARIAASMWRIRRIGYVTATYADQLRQSRRSDEIDHYLELERMRKTATPQEIADFDDGHGMSPWLSGMDMLAEEVKQPKDQRPLLTLMAAEERADRGLMAAIRLLGRVQKSQGVAEESEETPADERNEANDPPAENTVPSDEGLVGGDVLPAGKPDARNEAAGAAVDGCAGGTPAPQNEAAADVEPSVPVAQTDETKPIPDLDPVNMVVRASRLRSLQPPRDRPSAPEAESQASETKPPGADRRSTDLPDPLAGTDRRPLPDGTNPDLEALRRVTDDCT